MAFELDPPIPGTGPPVPLQFHSRPPVPTTPCQFHQAVQFHQPAPAVTAKGTRAHPVPGSTLVPVPHPVPTPHPVPLQFLHAIQFPHGSPPVPVQFLGCPATSSTNPPPVPISPTQFHSTCPASSKPSSNSIPSSTIPTQFPSQLHHAPGSSCPVPSTHPSSSHPTQAPPLGCVHVASH